MSEEKRLIDKLSEYIEFLTDGGKRNAVFLSIHGIYDSKDDIEKGKELRSEIIRLREDPATHNQQE